MKEGFFAALTPKEKQRMAAIEGRDDLFETKFFRIPPFGEAPVERTLLVATRDPGSAGALLPVMRELVVDAGTQIDVVTDGRAQEHVQKAFPSYRDITPDGSVLEGARVVGTPDVVLMDASTEMGLDTFVAATFDQVPKVLVEDYYTSSIKFLEALNERHMPFPEKICVMDGAAKDLIVQQFPELEKRIVVTGQPSFDRFATEDTAEIAREVRKRLGVGESEKLVSYMSTMDEPEKIKELASALKQVGTPFSLVFRRHPRDNTTYQTYKKILTDAGIRVIDTDGFTTDEIGAASDVILTTWSTSGLEGIYRRKPTVHIVDKDYRVEEGLVLPLPPVSLGASVGLEKMEGLSGVLPQLLDEGSELTSALKQRMEKEYPADGKNAQRVADVVRTYLTST